MKLTEWRFSARMAFQDRLILVTVLATVLVIAGMSFFLLFRLIPEGLRSSVLTLHYNIYLGIDEVRPWQWIFILPTAMTAAFLCDLGFALGLFRKDPLASKALLGFAFVMSLLWAAGCFFLIMVNI